MMVQCALADDQNNADLFKGTTALQVTGELVNYGPATGYLATPQQEGTYPAVVMIHEWWGLNDNIKDMAMYLANEGFVVLAVDLFDGEVALDSAKARALTGAVRENPDIAIANMRAAVSYVHVLEIVKDQKVGSMGWCFGGGQSLNLALSDEIMDATVIYYGNIGKETEDLNKISWPVLGIFGEEDRSISVESVLKFEKQLNELGIDNEIYIYPGVGHAFANPSGSSYAPTETKDAWEKTLSFLNTHLKS